MRFIKLFLIFSLVFIFVSQQVLAQAPRAYPVCQKDKAAYLQTFWLCSNYNEFFTWNKYLDDIQGGRFKHVFQRMGGAAKMDIELAQNGSVINFFRLRPDSKLRELQNNPWFLVALNDCFGGNATLKARFYNHLTLANFLGSTTALARLGLTAGSFVYLPPALKNVGDIIKHVTGVFAYRAAIAGMLGYSGYKAYSVYSKEKERLEKIENDPDGSWLDIINFAPQIEDAPGCEP